MDELVLSMLKFAVVAVGVKTVIMSDTVTRCKVIAHPVVKSGALQHLTSVHIANDRHST